MKDALKSLNDKQVGFICRECHQTKESLFAMDEDTLYDFVYEVMCDIECEETVADNTLLTERGKLAKSIVAILGNAIAEADGLMNEKD